MSDENKVTEEPNEKEERAESDGEALDEGLGFDDKIEAAMAKIVEKALLEAEEEETGSLAGDLRTAEERSREKEAEDEDEDEDESSFLKEYQESLKAARRAAKAAENNAGAFAAGQENPASGEKLTEWSLSGKSEKRSEKTSGKMSGGSAGKTGDKKAERLQEKAADKKQEKKPARSARPQPIGYIPVEQEHKNVVPFPENGNGEEGDTPKKKHKGLKITGLAAAMIIAAAGTAYAGVSYYYTDKFFNGTVINGIDCSGKTAYEVEQELAQRVSDYSIQVASRNQAPQVISGNTINYRYVSDGSILNFLKSQKPYEWIRGFLDGQTSYNVSINATYDKELLKSQVTELECAQPENQVEPENAYVAYTDTRFEIVPETEGSLLDIKNAYKALDAAIADGDTSIDFSSEPEAYVKAAVTSDSENLHSIMDACNNFTRANITYDFGNQSVTLDGSIIKDWLVFDDKNQLVEDDASFQQHIADYVAQIAAQYDTVGTEREFYTTSGRVVYVYGSNYGWKIDQAAETAKLTEEVRSGETVTREPIYSMTANAHGINDFGDTYIEVDMGDQHMYYYQNGSIIFDSDFVSGDINYSDRATPSGIYTLYFKTSPATLRGQINPETGEPEYETDVTYWMPFNGGIGFHDASWQPYFGGDRYTYGGSHGCINLPYYAAAELYSIIQYDVPIICFY